MTRSALTQTLLVCSLLLGSPVLATPANNLFEQPQPLQMTLTGPWRALAADRAEEPEWQPARLQLADGTNLALKARPRGKSRRQKSFCAFPPLWLKFDRTAPALAATPFAGHNRLKLVTQCKRLGSSSAAATDQVLSEYLLYRVLNTVTDYSYRVRLVQINYVEGKHADTHWGFLIEHKQQLAQRLQLKELKQPSIPSKDLDTNYAALVSVFQFLAGNTDFSLRQGPPDDNCCHNAVPFAATGGKVKQVFSIPYDFDSTGFVDPPYATPVPRLGIKKVTQRVYRGYCAHNDGIPAAIDAFQQAQERVQLLLAVRTELSAARQRKLQRYIADFYKVLNDPKAIERKFRQRCR